MSGIEYSFKDLSMIQDKVQLNKMSPKGKLNGEKNTLKGEMEFKIKIKLYGINHL